MKNYPSNSISHNFCSILSIVNTHHICTAAARILTSTHLNSQILSQGLKSGMKQWEKTSRIT